MDGLPDLVKVTPKTKTVTAIMFTALRFVPVKRR